MTRHVLNPTKLLSELITSINLSQGRTKHLYFVATVVVKSYVLQLIPLVQEGKNRVLIQAESYNPRL